MFDIPVRKRIDPLLDWMAAWLYRWKVRPNTITWLGFSIGIAGSGCIAFGYYHVALVLIALNRVADGLDGCVARRFGSSDVGGFLDIALDMIFYSSVPFAFAVARPENTLAGAFLIYSFFGTGSSFLAFAIIAAKRGQSSDQAGRKSFFHSTGLIEGTETAVFLMLICLLPQHFPVMAWVFGGLCWLTTFIRIAVGIVAFKD